MPKELLQNTYRRSAGSTDFESSDYGVLFQRFVDQSFEQKKTCHTNPIGTITVFEIQWVPTQIETFDPVRLRA